jgi:hypothetical protein
MNFASASNGIVDTTQAVENAISEAGRGHSPADCRMVVLHLTMGHDHTAVVEAIRRHCPKARIVGCTCAGVIGREGANEGMRAVALMMIWGEENEIGMSIVEHLDGRNSFEAAGQLARDLVQRSGRPRFVMFLASGIDVDVEKSIAGLESVLGAETTIFGGTSADNMKGIASFQIIDDHVHEHAAVLVGFFDPSLEVYTQASHGFIPAAVEMTVTRSTGNQVHELDGAPAWHTFTRNLGLPETATPADTIPPGAVGVKLERRNGTGIRGLPHPARDHAPPAGRHPAHARQLSRRHETFAHAARRGADLRQPGRNDGANRKRPSARARWSRSFTLTVVPAAV